MLGWRLSEADPLLPRSPRSSAAGAGPCAWASRARTPPASTPTPCPSMPAPTWCPRAASGPRRYPKSLQTRATSSPSGWTRRAACSTASMTRPPCSSSTGSARPTRSGPWWMSTASRGASSCLVSDLSPRPRRCRAHLQVLWFEGDLRLSGCSWVSSTTPSPGSLPLCYTGVHAGKCVCAHT